MSTSRLRLQKISAFLTSSERISRRNASRLSCGSTTASDWMTVAAGDAGGATEISTGSCRKASASLRISAGIVAEKNRVCRFSGNKPTIRSTSGMKPMSSIRSASSMTRMRASDSRILPRPCKIEKAPRRRDQHIDAAVELAFLIDKAFAADQQRHRQPMVLAVELERGGDLGRQLARRLEDQRARHAHPRPPGRQHIDHRQHKARGLAGAGLRAAQNIPPALDVRDGLFLDRGGIGIAGVGNCLKNFRRKIKFGKIH